MIVHTLIERLLAALVAIVSPRFQPLEPSGGVREYKAV